MCFFFIKDCATTDRGLFVGSSPIGQIGTLGWHPLGFPVSCAGPLEPVAGIYAACL